MITSPLASRVRIDELCPHFTGIRGRRKHRDSREGVKLVPCISGSGISEKRREIENLSATICRFVPVLTINFTKKESCKFTVKHRAIARLVRNWFKSIRTWQLITICVIATPKGLRGSGRWRGEHGSLNHLLCTKCTVSLQSGKGSLWENSKTVKQLKQERTLATIAFTKLANSLNQRTWSTTETELWWEEFKKYTSKAVKVRETYDEYRVGQLPDNDCQATGGWPREDC